jgi:hypothetical protein
MKEKERALVSNSHYDVIVIQPILPKLLHYVSLHKLPFQTLRLRIKLQASKSTLKKLDIYSHY